MVLEYSNGPTAGTISESLLTPKCMVTVRCLGLKLTVLNVLIKVKCLQMLSKGKESFKNRMVILIRESFKTVCLMVKGLIYGTIKNLNISVSLETDYCTVMVFYITKVVSTKANFEKE